MLPVLLDAESLVGCRAVVVDVLRATTTVVQALSAGARAVVPCLTIEDARRRAAEFPPGEVLLGGERGGLRIKGFDLGNSPAEYTVAGVGGKTIVLTTTNGTKALARSELAAEVLLGAFVNLSALCSYLSRVDSRRRPDVVIVCAGTEGHVTRDDVLLAGAIAERLAAEASWELDDTAAIARDAWHAVAAGRTDEELVAQLSTALLASRGGRNLHRIGMRDDIELAARIDCHSIVPRWDAAQGTITAVAL